MSAGRVMAPKGLVRPLLPAPPRAVYHKGVGGPGLSRYLAEANSEVEVMLQVETKACFESMDDVLSVPGITSAFLGAQVATMCGVKICA